MRNTKNKDSAFSLRFKGRTHRMGIEGQVGLVKSAKKPISDIPNGKNLKARIESKQKAEISRIRNSESDSRNAVLNNEKRGQSIQEDSPAKLNESKLVPNIKKSD